MTDVKTSVEAEGQGTHNRKGYIPRKEKDLFDVATLVAKRWEENPDIKLIWTDLNTFKECISEFGLSAASKDDGDGERSPLTQNLRGLDKAINAATKHLKGYLSEKYPEEEVTAYYAKFGIAKSSQGFRIPSERSKRKAALDLVCKAIESEGFSDKKYGKVYWETMNAQYKEFSNDANNLDGIISSKVSIKNRCAVQIKKTLNSIIKVLQANYPDNYGSILREWGFQKEKY